MNGGLGFVHYGLVLRNNSRRGDAFGVSVTVKAFDAQGRVLATDYNPITMIPSATDVVANGLLAWNVAVRAARISTVVTVDELLPTLKPNGRALPTFTDIKLRVGSVSGRLANPYGKRMPAGAGIYALFLDNQGRIVDIGSDETSRALLPHQSIPYTLNADPPSSPDATAVKVSVDPCADVSTVCPASPAIISRPVAMTADSLRRYSIRTEQKFYWAGPEAGVRYEYRETENGYMYVRYLTAGAAVGNASPNYLTVATYPTLDAYSKVREQLGRRGWAKIPVGPHVIAAYDRAKPTNVHVAFAGQAEQIEVYDHTPGAAIALVQAGTIRPLN